MHRLLIVFISIFFLSSDKAELNQGVVGGFGVRVSYQANGSILTFIGYTRKGNIVGSKRVLTRDEFIKFASGYWPSTYNPDGINLFWQYQIDCGVGIDTITLKEYCYCSPLDSLWKIRFSHYPFDKIYEEGWSGKNYRPSTSQDLFLYQEYGIRQVDSDFFTDSSLFKLLRDVNDEKWISHYRTLR